MRQLCESCRIGNGTPDPGQNRLVGHSIPFGPTPENPS
nr:hypothetical protein [Kibdelosporangium sp. MJ126-NF4]CTQ89958.1 hypothetical protein [Kibdelosporangium sp. MJ126-NF4]